jgi:hypothetical protein
MQSSDLRDWPGLALERTLYCADIVIPRSSVASDIQPSFEDFVDLEPDPIFRTGRLPMFRDWMTALPR